MRSTLCASKLVPECALLFWLPRRHPTYYKSLQGFSRDGCDYSGCAKEHLSGWSEFITGVDSVSPVRNHVYAREDQAGQFCFRLFHSCFLVSANHCAFVSITKMVPEDIAAQILASNIIQLIALK